MRVSFFVIIAFLLNVFIGIVDLYAQEKVEGQDNTEIIIELGHSDVGSVSSDDSGLPVKLYDPLYYIEKIEIIGRRYSPESKILGYAKLQVGEQVNLKGLEEAKFRLVSSGLFKSLEINLRPGTSRQRIVIQLVIEERDHIFLNDLYLGASRHHHFWGGFDVRNPNFLGFGHQLGLAWVGDNRSSGALDLSYVFPNVYGSIVSLGARGFRIWESLKIHSKDLEDVSGRLEPERIGVSLSLGLKLYKALRLLAIVEQQWIKSLSKGEGFSNVYLLDGSSQLMLYDISFVYDTRDSGFMPLSGHFLQLGVRFSFKHYFSDYQMYKVRARYLGSFRLKGSHLLRVGFNAGYVSNRKVYFENFYVGDFNKLVGGSSLGVNFAQGRGTNFLGMGSKSWSYEQLLMVLSVEYAYLQTQLGGKRNRSEFFGGISLIGARHFGKDEYVLGMERFKGKVKAFPLELSVDMGIRFETSLGVFCASLGRMLEFVPR